MSTSVTHLPPVVTPIVHKETGLPTLEQLIWQQELLLSRSPWIPYTPTIANLSALTVNDCDFSPAGKRIHVRIAVKGTSNGSLPTITLPFKMAGSFAQTFAVALVVGANATAFAGAVVVSADQLTLTPTKYDGSTPANLEVDFWRIQGVYEAL